jgi:hypothetical protein
VKRLNLVPPPALSLPQMRSLTAALPLHIAFVVQPQLVTINRSS